MSETFAGAGTQAPNLQAPDIQVDVKGLFPTPIAIVQMPDAVAVNGELKQAILARAASHPSTSHSNLGGWQSTWDFADWGGASGQKVIDTAKAVAGRLTKDRQGQTVQVNWKVNAWANVNRQGHGNEFHTHPGAFWSGCYYVEDGGIGEDPTLGGEFEIQDPRGVAPVMYAPMLTFAGPGGASLGASELLQPKPGMMVLFPSWLQHAVRPYRGTRERISVAFNLSL